MAEANTKRFQSPSIAVVVFAALLVYLPALRGGFVFDDWILLVQNPLIHAADGLRRIWFTTEAPDYYPVTWTSWWLQWRLFGDNPLGYHAVNVLLHAVNCVLVVQVLRRLEIAGAWLAGLIFAVHPVNVAAVAWVSSHKTLLAMCFFLATALAYLRFESAGQRRWFVAALSFYLLSLLSKPAAVMWPVVILGFAWWKRKQVTRLDCVRSLPFGLLSLLIAPVTVWFQASRVLGGEPGRVDDFASKLAGAGWAVWFYLFKVFVPAKLSMIYSRWEIDSSNLLVYLPGLLLIGAGIYCWRHRATWGRSIVAGIGYFTVMLFPVLGFFDQGFYRYSFVADHWQYLPILGVLALVAGGLSQGRKFLQFSGIAIVVILGALTWNRSLVYLDDQTMWLDTVAKNPKAWLAHYNLGVTRATQGRLEEAIVAYETALRLKPDDADVLNNLGTALAQQGRLAEAIGHWKSAVLYRPKDDGAHNNLGVAYAKHGDWEQASREFALVLKLRPNDPEAHANLGSVYLSQGRAGEAIEQFEAALQVNPGMLPVRLSLAFAFARAGRVSDAVKTFEVVLRADPTNRIARSALDQLASQSDQ